MDMTDVVCPDGACRPAVGNMIVYFDDDHLTASWVTSVGDELAARLGPILG